MPIEVKMLIYALLLLFVLFLVQIMTIIFNFGLVAGVGNRENFPAVKGGFAGRVDRSINNLKESLFFFIPLVLLAALYKTSNDMTILGSEIFLGGRLAHALLYLVGVPWLRSLAFGAGVIGIIMIAIGLGLPGALFG